MIKKLYLFYLRIQLIIKKSIKLVIISLVTFLLITQNNIPKVVAQNSSQSNIIVVDNQTNQPSKLLDVGLKLYQEGKLNQAKTNWLQAVTEFEQQGDKVNQALALNYLSLAHQQLGEWEEAENTIQASLNLIETNINIKKSAQNIEILARILNTKAKLLLSQGKTEEALDNWQQAEKIYSQIQDTQGVIGSQINQARALQSLGRFRDTIKLLSSLKNTIEDQSEPLKVNGLINLGNILRQVGNLEESLTVLKDAVTLAEKSQNPVILANALISLGNTERAIADQKLQLFSTKALDRIVKNRTRQDTRVIREILEKDYLKAFNSYQQAIDIAPSNLKIQGQLNQLSMLADISQWAGKEANKRNSKVPSLITEFINKAPLIVKQIQLDSSEKLPNQQTVYTRINLADSLIRIKSSSQLFKQISWEIINSQLQKAIKEARILEDKRAESEAFGKLGTIAELNQQWQEAQELTEKALSLSQSLRANEITYQWQWQLARIIHQTDKNIERETHIYNEAVNTLELVRKDLLGVNSESQFVFRQKVEPLYRQFADLLLNEPSPSKENKERVIQIINALQIAELENFLNCGLQAENAVPLEQVAQSNDAAIIYPIFLPTRVAVIVKLPNSEELLFYQKDNIPEHELALKLEELYESIISQTELTKAMESELDELYEWLIKPAEINPKWDENQIKTLVFVLDSKWRNIPMAALKDRETNKYLVEKYAIAVNLGLELTDPSPLQGKVAPAFVAGVYIDWERDLATIGNVKTEMDLIQKIIPQTKELRNQEFLKDKFAEDLKQKDYSLVHLATHAEFSSNSKDTVIHAWDQPISINDLGSIFQAQSQNRTKPIELLVLSACETAKGDERGTLGLAGVAIKSGARSTLASLWSIDDLATSILITNFYKHLTDEDLPNKAEALRRAQIDTIKYTENDYRAPFYWAPFILVGNWL